MNQKQEWEAHLGKMKGVAAQCSWSTADQLCVALREEGGGDMTQTDAGSHIGSEAQ